jgi:AAA+ superfamily predicted ATPase
MRTPLGGWDGDYIPQQRILVNTQSLKNYAFGIIRKPAQGRTMKTVEQIIDGLPPERRAEVEARARQLIAEELARRHQRKLPAPPAGDSKRSPD